MRAWMFFKRFGRCKTTHCLLLCYLIEVLIVLFSFMAIPVLCRHLVPPSTMCSSQLFACHDCLLLLLEHRQLRADGRLRVTQAGAVSRSASCCWRLATLTA
jgi:hypothetical protein